MMLRIASKLALLVFIPSLAFGKNLAFDQASNTVHPKLTALSRTMEQRVEKVTEKVYVAMGYDIANCVMVVGDGGAVVIDVLGNMKSAEQVMTEFRQITDVPIEALIYTHHHGDHINGALAFVDAERVKNGDVRIFAYKTLMANLAQQAGLLLPITASRAYFMYGNYLELGPEGRVNTGIGPALISGQTGFIPPTVLIDEKLTERIAGLTFEMVHVPSEALDEVAVWIPELKVLDTGEVLQGESFPNIYTLRGDVMRDPVAWVHSIDVLRQYPAEILVRSHGRPVVGKDNVAALLTAYRDAIQYVHDQTVRYINKGYTADELVTVVNALPSHLRDDPNLQEFYGGVKQSVRAIYNQYLGWFNGDPATLDPLPPKAKAQRYVEAMGGRQAVLANAEQALADGDYRWAAEITSYLITLNHADQAARQIKARAFRPLAYEQVNVTWRNFYLSAALEMEGKAPRPLGTQSSGALEALPLSTVLKQMPVRIDPSKSEDLQLIGAFAEAGGPSFAVEIRRGIAQFYDSVPDDPDFTVTGNKRGLFALAMGMRSLDQLSAGGEIKVSGSSDAASHFFASFDPPMPWDSIPVSLH